ncbi:MAG: Crp/Fnr family transcriptional regulator [Myxococcales bacterium]|nr:Crp/Fnr family transcriptional regulator [Myxococcales bacterium]
MADDKLFAKVGRTSPAGTILFRDGEAGAEMYVLTRGRVRIFKEVRGEEKTLATLGAGEFFGEMAILNDKPRTASAEVVEESDMLVIDGKTFGSMIVSNTEIAVRLIRKLASRLDNANELIDILMHRDPKARVILGLSREAEYSGVPMEGGGVRVPLDHAGLANQVGLPVEEVENVLARLFRLGILEDDDDGFRIPDTLRLHEFLEFLQMQEKFGEP